MMGHKLKPFCPGSDLWLCSCGNWRMSLPKIGAFGSDTRKARLAQVNNAHRRHAKKATNVKA